MPSGPEMPSTQTSAPVEPARTTEDVRPDERTDGSGSARREATRAGAPGDRAGERRDPGHGHGDPTGEQGDRMPLGADEPGAGL